MVLRRELGAFCVVVVVKGEREKEARIDTVVKY